MLLINGVPVVQIELKTLAVSPAGPCSRSLITRPIRQWLQQNAAVLPAALHRQQPDTWYFANNNAHGTSALMRMSASCRFTSSPAKTTRKSLLDSFAEVPGQVYLGANDQSLHGAGGQRAETAHDAALSNLCRQSHCSASTCGNGYIWHTTGSGKTLTSFKASTLLKDNPDIDKCLFVVDRKDLDRQTREEFNRFQEGCVEENTNTETLVRRLLSDDYADKVIVTTIQKLGLALDGPTSAITRNGWSHYATSAWCLSLMNATVHNSVTTTRPSRNSSPTPSFWLYRYTHLRENASYQQIEGQQASYRTTDDLFQRCLHQYTITTPSRIATSCAFTWITSSPKARILQTW
jgi:type I restriction enzyme R subunit